MNQNRIEGSYTIVSTYRPGRIQDSMSAVKYAWDSGLSVALVVGVWLGEREESLMLTGFKHAWVGRELACIHKQDAYITVEDGKATLYIWNGHAYVVGNTWNKQIDRTTEDSYTVMPSGRQFVFAA